MGLMVLFVSLASMAGIGVFLAVILAIADKKLAVKEDPRVEKALDQLPGANCGACGFAGCSAFANALAEGKVSVTGCKPGGAEVAKKLTEILGLEEAETLRPMVARVFCSGFFNDTATTEIYTCVETCVSANLVGADKAWGFGDCVEVCAFDAIHMGENGLPVVDLNGCTGCGACVDACPRNIIGLTEYDEVVHVYCRSRDKGAVTRKTCKAGCTACKLCEKDDDTGAVKVVDNLSVIDYLVNKTPVKATKRCPTKVIRISDPVQGYETLYKEKIKELEQVEEKK
jgi:RnfABCDGE-type electron transport complex B subunit